MHFYLANALNIAQKKGGCPIGFLQLLKKNSEIVLF